MEEYVFMATLKDVAREAGVTVTTVSRVINNRGYIGEQTRKNVFDAMKRLNYQPNELARSLSIQRTNTIGIIVPHIVHPYFAKLISNLESAAAKYRYKIILCNTKGETEKEKEYIEMCKSNRVSGIIMCSRNVDAKEIVSMDIPVVMIERKLEEGTIVIQCDNYMGGKLAAEHLIAKGCKSLIHFSGIDKEDMPADARAEAFVDVCEKKGVKHYEKKCSVNVYNKLDYHEHIKKALQEVGDADGVFASSDLIAAQVIQVCTDFGIKIPEQLKLVGFDDVDIAQLTTPSITTIRQPIKEMSEWAVEAIKKRLDGQVVPEQIKLPVTLIERQST
jgi:LacI family sucrose operon transcriptional repressor